MKRNLILLSIFILLTLFASQVLPASATTPTSIIIDGTNDFDTDEDVPGTSGSTWYFTWDNTNFYFGVNAADVGGGSSTKWVHLYLDTDPQQTPLSGNGTPTGVPYNTQTPGLPFNADFHFRWKTDNTYTNMLDWNNGTSSWTDDNTGSNNFGIAAFQSGSYVEFSIPRSSLGNPSAVYVAGAMINEQGGFESTFFMTPNSNTEGYDANYNHYFGFVLKDGLSPDNGDNVDCNPAIAVANNNDSGAGSLRQAIADVCQGGTITFNSGLSGATITLASTLIINHSMTIDGSSLASRVIISGNNTIRPFVINSSVTVTIDSLTITGGSVAGLCPSGCGGGIQNYGNLTLDHMYIHGNQAGHRGGGLYFGGGTSTINNSTIYNNLISTGGTSGGGIFVDGDSATVALTINNSTISGNTAIDSGGGVGVYQLSGTATATLNHVTVANNTAGAAGGGIARISAGTLNIGNSIVSGNSAPAGADCRGTIATLGYNMTGSSCTFVGLGDVNDNPLLSSLADNGGPTPTHALSTISPAVDLIPSGTNGCGTTYTTDQRGITRPIDGDGDSSGQCDVGALESLQACPTSVAYDTNYVVGDVTFHIPSGTGNTGNIDCFLVSPYQKNHPNATVPLQTGEYWQLGVFDNSGVAATGYNLSLTISNLSFTADDDDKLCRWDNPGWSCGEDTDNTPSGTSITRTGVTALSPWTAGNNASPTALQLQDLTVRPTSSTTHLALALIALIGLAAGVYLIRSRR